MTAPRPEPDLRRLFANDPGEVRGEPPADHSLSEALELVADRVELLGVAMHEFVVALRRSGR